MRGAARNAKRIGVRVLGERWMGGVERVERGGEMREAWLHHPPAEKEATLTRCAARQEGGAQKAPMRRAQSARQSSPSLLAITHGEGIWRQGAGGPQVREAADAYFRPEARVTVRVEECGGKTGCDR